MKSTLKLVAVLIVSWHSHLFAVPHIDGDTEPLFFSKLTPYQARLDKQSGLQTRDVPKALKAAMPSTVNAILLRVEFAADSLGTTTGDGTWLCDTADVTCPDVSDVGADGNYWVNKNLAALSNYYDEVSYGALQLNITLAPNVYTLAHDMSYYGQETAASIESLIYDAVTAADVDVDFSLYDVVFIVHAGPGQETDTSGDTPSDVWSLYYDDTQISQQDSASNPSLTLTLANGLPIDRAVIMPQTGSQDGLTVDPLGLFAHEFGHWLGWPDLYATPVLLTPTWDGIGSWGLMGHGIYLGDPLGSLPAHPSAWAKVYQGWVDPVILDPDTDPGALSLLPAETNASLVKIPNSADGSAYYLLENRQLTSYDAGLPGSGLLVWSINEDAINDGFANNSVNSWSSSPGVKLVEADNDDALLEYGGDKGSAGDPFPGLASNTAFTPWTTPSSATRSEGWLYLTAISEQPDQTIAYSAGFSPQVPSGIEELLSPNWMFKIRWTAATASDISHYRIYIDNELTSSSAKNEFTGLAGMRNHDIQISAVDLEGRESATSESLAPPDLRCFIATAAHGSAMAPQVELLREFRDRYLLTHHPGRKFVELYYVYSPPLADWISHHNGVRALVRSLLAPFIALAWLSTELGLIDALMIMLLGGLLLWHVFKALLRRLPYRSLAQ